MSRLLYLKKGEEAPAPFKLHQYVEPDGGRLHGPSTLAKLRLATLEMKEPGTNVYVPVAFHTVTELSIDCFTANSQDAPLAVRGEGVASAAGAAGVAGAAGATGTGDAGPGPSSTEASASATAFNIARHLVPLVLSALPKRQVNVSASTCSSSKWANEVQPILDLAFYLDFAARASSPCCPKLETKAPCNIPGLFEWPNTAAGEHDQDNTTALAQYLEKMAPAGVVVVPVQSAGWLHAHIDCSATDALYISNSKTDYLWMLKEGLDRVGGTITPETLPELLAFIIGMYEAKLPTTLNLSSRRQGVLQYLAVNYMRNPTGRVAAEIPVVIGDGNRHFCVHDAGPLDIRRSKRILHIAQPANPNMQPLTEPDRDTMSRIKGLLTQSAAAARTLLPGGTQGPAAGGSAMLVDEHMRAAGGAFASSSHPTACAAGTSQPPLGNTSPSGRNHGSHQLVSPSSNNVGASDSGDNDDNGGCDSPDVGNTSPSGRNHGSHQLVSPNSSSVGASDNGDNDDDGGCNSPDEATLEAHALNAHAQFMLRLLQEPSMYESLGLSSPPTYYSPPTVQDFFGSCTFLDPKTGLPMGRVVSNVSSAPPGCD